MTTTATIAETFADRQTLERFPAGTLLFREGDDPRGVFILYSGQVDLVFSAKNGNAKPLRIAEPGQILGLSCIVSHRLHDCSATTRTACELGFVERDSLLDEIDHNPAAWFSVLQFLSEDVNACYDCMRQITAIR